VRPTSETCLRFGFGFEQPEAGYARFQIFLHALRAKAEKSLKKNQRSKPCSRSVSRSDFRNIEDLYKIKKNDEKVRKSLKKKINVQNLALALFSRSDFRSLKICIK
jgi:hypothetical protein